VEFGRLYADVLTLFNLLGRANLTREEYQRLEDCLTRELTAVAAPRLLRTIARAGLMPLAYRPLIPRSPFAVAPALRSALTLEFPRHSISRYTATRRLRELLCALSAAGVDAWPFKGPVLAAQLYGNFAMRQFGDLDVIVRPRDVRAALAVLAHNGV